VRGIFLAGSVKTPEIDLSETPAGNKWWILETSKIPSEPVLQQLSGKSGSSVCLQRGASSSSGGRGGGGAGVGAMLLLPPFPVGF